MAITGVGHTVPAVGLPVTSIGVSVTLSGHAVTVVRSPVPLIGGMVDGIPPGLGSFPCGQGLAPDRGGTVSRASRLVAKLRLPIALGRGRRRSRNSSILRKAVAFVGDVVALVGDPIALVGEALTLTSSVRLFRGRASAWPLAVTFTGQFAPPQPRLAVPPETDHDRHPHPAAA